MARGFLFFFLALTVFSCGPSQRAFVGEYSVDASESFEDCSFGNGDPTFLAELATLSIEKGDGSDLILVADQCEFEASIVDWGEFEVGRQTCVVVKDPEATVKVSGSGSVEDDVLDMQLEGSYRTTDLGYQVECDYKIRFVSK